MLAGGVAHDFNNILVAVLGYAELARSDIPEESPAQRCLRQIETAAQRAAELCRQMLAYTGRGRYVVEHLNLGQLVAGMLNLLQASVSKRARLKVEPCPDLPGIKTDAAQLRQVVMNLVTNASEALPETGGEIVVSTGLVSCTADDLARATFADRAEPGEYVSLQVSDTGRGMDAETAGRVFEPFFSTKFAGRGLGMSAVLGIVRANKGAIWIDTEPGRGTTVRVLFPVDTKASEPVGPSDPLIPLS